MPETPQFQTAEFDTPPSADSCCICRQPITGSYYRVQGSMACSACAQQVLERRPEDSRAAFIRALLFGAGGALLGLILYSAVGILLNIEIGWISLAVGYLVAKAMMYGSRGHAGRRYQWAAILLTYAAVSLSAIPIAFHQANLKSAAPVKQSAPASAPATTAPDDVSAPNSTPPESGKQEAPMSFGHAIVYLFFIGLASPILNLMESPGGGLIGLVILFVGMRIAWQMTASSSLPAVEGPF